MENTKVVRNECARHIDRKKRVFDIVYLALTCALAAVALATGFVSLPLFTVVLAIAAALLIALRAVRDKGVPLYLWIAYLVAICGTFLLFVIRGADGFGKRLWWNLVLSLGPVVLAVAIYFADKISPERYRKLFTSVTAVLMAGVAIVYFFFMSLRLTPTVESLQKGHDEYLAKISATKASADSPNVLVILMDDMAYSDISLYSYLGSAAATINTPNIDRIADGGIVMDNFYSASPVCSPSRFSLLTGRYSSRGYLDNVVFPTTVESDPYSFTHFVNPYQFLNSVDNDMTPYNWVRDTGAGHPEGETHAEIRTHEENLDQSESTRIFTEQINEFIESSVDKGEKFLAYYTTPWPHWPLFSDNNGNGKGDVTDDTYIDCIEEFDKYLGTILDTLERKGVYDDTLIIFTSDNGPGREGVTGSLRGRKNTTFEGGMKVPLIASYPNGGVGAGSAVASEEFSYFEWVKGADGRYSGEVRECTGSTKHIVASSMNFDLFTTILDYCGITELPSDRIIDGVSLRKLWSAEVPADTRVHDVLYYQKGGKTQGIQMAYDLDGKTYDFKYYDRVHTENSAFIDQFYNNYLFNLDLDPAEGYDISKTYPEIADALKEKLEAFRKEMKTNRRGITDKERS